MIRAALLAIALTGCANLEQRANTAAVTDGATTLVGVGIFGASELSPLGLASVAIKVPLLAYVKTLPEAEQAAAHAVAGPVWGGASVSNGCMLAVLLSGGTAAPGCLALGIGYGVYRWNADRDERNFYAACAEYVRWSGERVRCVYQMEASE